MRTPIGTSLSRYIHERELEHPGARGDLSEVLEAIGLASRLIHRAASQAGLADVLGVTGTTNVHGETVKKLDAFAHDAMVACLEHVGRTCLLASEESEDVIQIPTQFPMGDYAVAFDPLDGSGNIDTNMPLGTIFTIYRRISPVGLPGEPRDFLRQGSEQVAAGYVLYGSSTMLVYTCGAGVNGFTLDPSIGTWLLSHPDIQVPARGRTYSVNAGNRAYWSPGVRLHVEDLERPDAARRRPYALRHAGALVADVHRILLQGGIFMYPADTKDPKLPSGKLRLLYECAPMAFVVEQAGGAASDGRGRIMAVPITSLHQRTPLFIGSTDDVEQASAAASAG